MVSDKHRTLAMFAVSGMIAGLGACAGGAPTPFALEPAPADAAGAPPDNAGQCCNGKNSCARKGHCKVEGSHDCRGRNACSGQGGPRSGPACTDEQLGG